MKRGKILNIYILDIEHLNILLFEPVTVVLARF